MHFRMAAPEDEVPGEVPPVSMLKLPEHTITLTVVITD
jgi:hypothetical protein